MRRIKAGSTSRTIEIVVKDSSSTVGGNLAGLTNATSGLTWYYHRQGANAAVAVSLVSATLGTWTSGGFIVVDGTNMPGHYEIGIPDAALAGGSKYVTMILKGATNMVPVEILIELVALDDQDAVRGGMSALPNVAAGANGGLPTGDASGRVTVGTNNDKAGYALSQAFPSNFASLVITVGGAITAGTVSDKTGYSLGATGLDSISVADPGAPANHTTLAKMLVAIYRALWKKNTQTSNAWKRYADNGTTVNATSTLSDDGNTQSYGDFN